ncbi:MAG: subtilisin family serine protease [Crocinitomicaceae bacterium]|jgi:subtilisin family serine protease
MTRISLVLFCLISYGSFSQDAYYALAPCIGESQQTLIEKCESEKIEMLTKANSSGYIIVKANNVNQLDGFCYHAEVRRMDDKLCFNTKVLLVKSENPTPSIMSMYNLVPHRIIPNLYYSSLNVKNDAELLEVKLLLEKEPAINYVGFNQGFTITSTVNDPLYDRQWNIENTGTPLQGNGTPGADMSIDSAWTITTGSPTIKIAVLDSGVDTLHVDLINNLLPGFDGFATDSTDTQGFPTPNFSNDGHGTSCAGIIAAEGDNGIGIAGIAYDSKIIPVRVFFYMDYGPGIGIQAFTSTDALLSGAAYAWRIADADVISTSAGLSDLFIAALGIDTTLINNELTEAFNDARSGKGIAMFFSSGNDDIGGPLWPSNLPTTIAVGASTMCDERKSASDCSSENWGGNYGEGLDFIAPGVKITTTDMMGTFGYSTLDYTYSFNGTSASCPNAAAVAALILSVNPGLHAVDVHAIMNITADRVPNYVYDSITPHGTWNNEVGYGRVNAYAAVQLAQTYQSTAEVGVIDTDFSSVAYPNPSNGSFSINVGPKEDVWEVKLMNLQGQLVLDEKRSMSGIIQFDLEHAPGIYLLSVQNGENQALIKMVNK